MYEASTGGASSVVHVANPRLMQSFGFLPGREVEDDPSASVNAGKTLMSAPKGGNRAHAYLLSSGLLDERLGLEWVRKCE